MRRIIEKRFCPSMATKFKGDNILRVTMDLRHNMYAEVEQDENREVYTNLIVFKTDDAIPGDEWQHVTSIDGLHLYRKPVGADE